jgi:hypothetical protein
MDERLPVAMGTSEEGDIRALYPGEPAGVLWPRMRSIVVFTSHPKYGLSDDCCYDWMLEMVRTRLAPGGVFVELP